MGVSGDQVGSVIDGSDVAKKNSGAGTGSNGRAKEVREVGAQRGIGAGDALERAGKHIAGGHDHAGPADRGDGFLGGDAILLQLGGIEHDHDGPLIPTERRRRGNAGQSREQRAAPD